MSIEIKLQSVVLQSEDIQEQFPNLVSMIKTYLPTQKRPKRKRTRKVKANVLSVLDDIIDSIDEK